MRFGTSTSGNNNGNPDAGDRASLASLGAAIRRQAEEAAHDVSTLQRSGVGIVTVLRKMEGAVQALSTRDLFWKVGVDFGFLSSKAVLLHFNCLGAFLV